jgi:hypothetical protein
MEDRKKIAAAVSAVFAYMRTQEEMACLQAAEHLPQSDRVPGKAATPVRLWGVSGRQAQMQLRNTMQLKGFHGTKRR